MKKEIRNEIKAMMANYSKDDFELFCAEYGWADWMNDYTDAKEDEPITEREAKEIDDVLLEIWEEVHSNEVKKIRDKTGLSQAKFADAYNIPKRTIENWESGTNQAPSYVVDMLERIVDDDLTTKFYVVENRHLGGGDFLETVIYTGTQKECAAFEDEQRKTYPEERSEIDCWTVNAAEYTKTLTRKESLDEYLASLSDEERAEVVEIGGKRYKKAILDFNAMLGL